MEKLIKEFTKSDGRIYPFLWLKGNSDNIIRELQAIKSSNIKNLCIESRAHKEFGTDAWFRDVDIVMDFAKANGFKVWLLDDASFPTGYANGYFKTKYSERKKVCLYNAYIDAIGGDELLFDIRTFYDMPFMGIVGQLKAIVLAKRNSDGTFSELKDITSQYSGEGLLRLKLAKGKWRIFIVFTQSKGGREDYMNLIDSKSVDVLLEAVYEPHIARYRDLIGTTFMGFFSDEPELGNFKKEGMFSYTHEDKIGDNISLPYSEQLEQSLKSKWTDEFALNLVRLWYKDGAHLKARLEYMDNVANLVKECFSDKIGSFCVKNNLEYAGHFIEDNNAHARLSSGAAHYFRASAGMSFAGVDVVLNQIVPGEDDDSGSQFLGSKSDREFYNFSLATLAASAAKLQRNKKGRALCEIFGAYGWSEGLKLMKFLADHMLVRGINYFVPHAFSDGAFPDFDCPPHFFAAGANPQFKLFSHLINYMERLGSLLSSGERCADTAVLYHAEAEWLGGDELMQKPLRALMERQIAADIVPFDVFTDTAQYDTKINDGFFSVNGYAYKNLLVPKALNTHEDFLKVFNKLIKNGINVLPYDKVSKIKEPSQVKTASKDIRVLTYKRQGKIIIMLFNEGENEASVELPFKKTSEYNAFKDTLKPCTNVVKLAPYQARVFVESDFINAVNLESIVSSVVVEPEFTILANGNQVAKTKVLSDMNQGALERFAGVYTYAFNLSLPKIKSNQRLILDFGSLYESAELIVNNNLIDTIIAPPYAFDLSKFSGQAVELMLNVTTTLGRAVRDVFSRYRPFERNGLIGPLKLITVQ